MEQLQSFMALHNPLVVCKYWERGPPVRINTPTDVIATSKLFCCLLCMC